VLFILESVKINVAIKPIVLNVVMMSVAIKANMLSVVASFPCAVILHIM